mgnify:FL=1|tara:strand:- start:1922 stop:2479 length:558 start_codon:yes stop_codon:yes gene_type:complete
MPATYITWVCYGVPTRPGTKTWRKYFKSNLVKLGEHINRFRTPVEKAEYDNFNSSKRDRVEYKILTHIYHCDTKNAILQVRIFKKLCQETAASILGTGLCIWVYDSACNGELARITEGDEAYKYQMEHMGKQIKVLEVLCRALITYDLQNSLSQIPEEVIRVDGISHHLHRSPEGVLWGGNGGHT